MGKPYVPKITPNMIEFEDMNHAWLVGGMYTSHNGFMEAVKYPCPNMGQVTLGEKRDREKWLLPKLY